ncbi:MAG: hypothetical protein ORN54_15070 [Cyclobacteriaceae bacterium]|nr:hypothetical protein [Cyclobacteriaceae bacterium]
MGESLSYEYLIRSAYNVGRSGKGGAADASLYRDWEVNIRAVASQKKAIKARTTPPDTRSIEELEYQVRVSASQVRENVREAIRAVLRTPRPSTIAAKLAELESVLVLDLYDKEKIDSVIDQAWELFKELKLPQTS